MLMKNPFVDFIHSLVNLFWVKTKKNGLRETVLSVDELAGS